MKYILCIESGTTTCSVALSKGKELLDVIENHDTSNNHAQQLTVFIEQLLEKQGMAADDLSAVAVSKGPGSYTGLRIGVSVAKGICFATGKPLIAINSLESMAYGALDWLKNNPDFPKPDYLCPMIDARRLEVYTQFFDLYPKGLSEIEAKILDSSSFLDILDKGKILFFGNGSAKAKEIIIHNNANFIDGFYPSARFMIPLALEHMNNEIYEDVAYFEPLYLKDFVAIKASNKLLGS
jgi:tRNA threonylcarbamoyladenosine biosynthesis protein TsaB